MMSPLWLVPAELLLILGGIVAALIVGPDRALRKVQRQQEMIRVDEFLDAIRASRPMRQE